jgi:L-ascorbate metabolism protein UlaG (beta-lactamase superfamily)
MCTPADLDAVPHDHDLRTPRIRVTRRRFLEVIGIGTTGAVVAACAPAAAPSPSPTRAASPAATVAASAAPTATPAPTVNVAALVSTMTWYAQAAFRWKDSKIVYVDPGNWLTGDLPPADLVLITHPHGDHFDKPTLAKIVGPNTTVVGPDAVTKELTGQVKTVKPGDRIDVGGIKIEALPAYNTDPARLNFHPKANNWVGYVFDLGGRTYYHAGDTDVLPELQTVKADVVLVPIGGGFTMSLADAATLVKAQNPKIAVPMHYGYVSAPDGSKVGTAADGEKFKSAAAPVAVQVFTPLTPFKNQ